MSIPLRGRSLKVASLFSGIGGLDLGLEQSGHEVVLQVERNPHCVQVLQHHFPGRQLVTDVASIHALPQEVDLLAAGFPCQVSNPLSDIDGNRPTDNKICALILRTSAL